MSNLPIEIRSVNAEERQITGVAVPYGETTYRTPDPAGERVMAGAFKESIRTGKPVPLLRNHDQSLVLGKSQMLEETSKGLVARFKVNKGEEGDRLLADLKNEYLTGLSVGFWAKVATRAADGVREVREAILGEVSCVGLPAYSGSVVLAIRRAEMLDRYRLPPRPEIDLSPLPKLWG